MRYLDKNRLAKNIEARMAADIADGRVGGAGICVMQDGEEVYKGYFGVKTQAGREEIGDDTIFRLASMSKPITAVAALIQCERGLLSLDEPISRLLPDFAEMQVAVIEDDKMRVVGTSKTPLTVRHLLSHTNGLGTGPGCAMAAGPMTAEDMSDPAHAVAYHARTALEFEPGTAQFYSAFAAFDVVGRLVELTSGKSFAEFLKDEIFDPCGMKDTTFAPTAEQWTRFIGMHDRIPGAGQPNDPAVPGQSIDSPTTEGCVFEYFPTTQMMGGAGLAATLPDYVRFSEMLTAGGILDGKRILSPEWVRAMGTPTVPVEIMPDPIRWGLGVRVISADGYQMPKNCFGWSGAYGTHFWIDPDNRISAVYMKNCRYDGGAGAATAFLFEQDVYAAMKD